MNEHALIVEVRLLADRWYGSGGWPPSPFRLFQALVAGAYGGRWRTGEEREPIEAAFRWLECLPAPEVIAPRSRSLNSVAYFVPNNDLDVQGNDPRRVAKLRVEKVLKSTLLDSNDPFAYIWGFDGSTESAERIASVSERLHTFGRGMDGAFARGLVTDARFAKSYSAERATLCVLPSRLELGVGGLELECPVPGSLESLHTRYSATIARFKTSRGTSGKVLGSVFRQPPKADLRLIAYQRPTRRLVFEVREPSGRTFYPVRVNLASAITTQVRDVAFDRLSAVMDDQALRERVVLGRGATDADRSARCRFIALPSIGTRYTDASIRRIAVELPPDCPLQTDDVRWALAGQPLIVDDASGEIHAMLFPAADESMLRRYIGHGSHRWQTVTPAVLPTAHAGGRVAGGRRCEIERVLALSVRNALRHAGVAARPTEIRIQREPLFERGSSASEFVSDRFGPARLHHVEIRFAEREFGPLLVGDGRWLSLGLMRPISDNDEHKMFDVETDGDTDELEIVDEADGDETDEAE